jgi:hypothetical protein
LANAFLQWLNKPIDLRKSSLLMEKVPEITRRFLSSRRWPVDSVEFGERLERKIWNKSSFKHRPMGNSLQD